MNEDETVQTKMSILAIKQKYTSLSVQVKAAFWFLMCSFLQKGISMITAPIFTRILSAAEYGQFSVFNSWLGIIGIFVTLNLQAGVFESGLVSFSEDKKTFASSIQGLELCLCLVWTMIYICFRDFINTLLSLSTVQILAMLFLLWSGAVFGFWSCTQRVNNKYKLLAVITILYSVFNPVLGVFLILHSEDKVTARIIGICIANLIFYSWMSFCHFIQGKKFFSKKYWVHALSFNLPLIPHYLSQMILNSSDRIMIQRLVGEKEAGIYSLAYSISCIMIIFNSSIMSTFGPWMYTKIKDNKINDLAPVAYGSLMIVGSVNIVLIAFAPEIIHIFAPVEYYEAIYCIPPVTLSVYFMYSYDLFAKFQFYYKKTNLIALATVMVAVLNIALNLVFIKVFGYIAAAYTTLVCFMLYSIFHYCVMLYVCKKEFNKNKPYSANMLLLITAVFFIIGFIYMFSYQNTILRYSITLIFFIISFIFRKKILGFIKQITKLKTNSKT